MTDMAAEVTEIRAWLDDHPIQAALNDAGGISASDTSFTVDAGQGALFAKGQWWEFQDGTANNAECVLIDSVATDTVTMPTGGRGFKGTTAAIHADDSVLFREPRYRYNVIAKAYNFAIDTALFDRDVYEIQEHEVTSSSTTNAYNASTSSCERILDIYQRAVSTDVPQRSALHWVNYKNADTDLWANGKVFEVYGNYGVSGTAVYYVNCAHKLAIGTLSTNQARICQTKAVANLLRFSTPRRLQGPTNQGDRTVRPADPLVVAREFELEYERLVRQEASYLKRLTATRRVFVREG